MALKIQLDNAALDRLIGGDSEMELELRKSIVENFANQKLSTLAATPEMQAILREALDRVRGPIQNEVEVQVRAHIGNVVREAKYPNRLVGQLKPELEAAIREAVSKYAEEKVDALEGSINQKLKEHGDLLEATINRRLRELTQRLERTLDKAYEANVEAEVTRRWDALMARLKEGA